MTRAELRVKDLRDWFTSLASEMIALDALELVVDSLFKQWCAMRGLHGLSFTRVVSRPNYRARFVIQQNCGATHVQIGIGNLEDMTLDLSKCKDQDVAQLIAEFFENCGFEIVRSS